MSTAGDEEGREPAGAAEVGRAILRAERAQDKFARELDGLIADLREAREAIRANPLPGEGG
jgi:hypothetical protein